MTLFQLTEPELREVIRTAKEAAWDEVVSNMAYPDGSPVQIAENNNPYRTKASK